MARRIEWIATLAAALAAPGAWAAPACSARSAATPTPLIELYTSEGCSSCPPADKWLSALAAQQRDAEPAPVALAFHVDYWDRLGWTDRHASAAYTRRQAQQQRSNGARFSYTPQVVTNGIDRPDWPGLRHAPQAEGAARVAIELERSGDGVVARIAGTANAPAQLAAYWAVTEDGHATQVRAGENQGARLLHDRVVRELVEVPGWPTRGATSPQLLRFTPQGAADPAHPRRINLVVLDAGTGRPLQALALACWQG